MKTLAIAVDGADEALVRRLMDRGDMPALARLRAGGNWSSVTGPGGLGNQANYLTLSTGQQPRDHGIYTEWMWAPERMSVAPARLDPHRVIWRELHDSGVSVGLLDAPVTPHLGLCRGFEVTDWGAHDRVSGRTSVSPPELASLVGHEHPFATGRFEGSSPDHMPDLPALVSACIEGARLRGDLASTLLARTRPDVAFISFSEIHRASHDLWPTVEPDHPWFVDLPPVGPPGLVDVYRAVDTQVGRLLDGADADSALAVFSLTGFRAGRGLAFVVLSPVLEALGYSCPAQRRIGSASGMAGSVLAAARRRTPKALRSVYRRRVPMEARHRLAAQTALPALDWARTRAFALPTDQNGLVRINLRGREAEGVVSARDYRRTCDELAAMLRGLRTVDGRPVVEDVIPGDPSGEPQHLLPDLVVHWADAAFDRIVRLEAPAIEVSPTVPAHTGQHRPGGFCVARQVAVPASIDAADLIACLTLDADS